MKYHHELQELIRDSKLPEWTTVLKELTTRHLSSGSLQHIKQLHIRLHTAETLVNYARATVSRLVMRQIASETQAIIIKDVMSKRKSPMPQGSGVLDNIEGLEKKGVKLTKTEKAKLEKHLESLGIRAREMALFRLFRETARDIAHPDLETLPHDAINQTALDSLREASDDSKLETYGREVLETYWRTLRYFSEVHTRNTRRKETKKSYTPHTEKIHRDELRKEIEKLPIPPFSEVVDSVYKLSKLDDKTPQKSDHHKKVKHTKKH